MRTYNLCKGGRALRIAFGIAMLSLYLAWVASAATLTVNASGGAMYTKIQDAIDNATAGDTILVYSGTYFENVNVNKLLIMRGIGMPVVNASGSGSAITLAADGIVLEGFTAEGGSFPGVGIRVTSNNNTLSGNNASNNFLGISMVYSSNNMLSDNYVSNNEYGFYLYSSSYNNLSGNNGTNNDMGIYLDSSSHNIFSGNNDMNNSFGINLLYSSNNNTLIGNNANSNNNYGIWLRFSSSSNTLIGNNASNNDIGIFMDSSSNYNTLSRNNASNNSIYGIYLILYCNNNTIYNNYFSNTNNAIDDGNNIWNIPKTSGTNIINGAFLGGNFWSDYAGNDTDGDGLGDTMLPYTSSGGIANGGDFLPLTIISPPTAGNISGFKINDTNGNGKWDAGEKGISNWTIRLIGIIGKGKDSKVIRKETLTDATGFYKFDNLQEGRYFIIEKLKKGFVPTSSPVKRIKLAQGKNSMNNNFTNRPVNSRDKKNDDRDIDDYEAINRDIDKYKEDMNWD